jgi:hypothetical protein
LWCGDGLLDLGGLIFWSGVEGKKKKKKKKKNMKHEPAM